MKGRSGVFDYPESIVPVDHIEPVPRRIRGVLNGVTVFDTTRALYVWEWPKYPRYYIPFDDVDPEVVVDERHPERLRGEMQDGTASAPAGPRRWASGICSPATRSRPSPG